MSNGFEGRIGFIGAGKMATALAAGLTSEMVRPEQLCAFDVFPSACETFSDQTGASIASSNLEVVTQSDLVFLAVKPQQLTAVMSEVAEGMTAQHLVVSIAAGVTLTQMQDSLGNTCRLVRVMPNTPALVGTAASAFALGNNATHDDAMTVLSLLNTVGSAHEVPEPLLDAVTGLSGSGPAYVYQFIEALSDGGVRVGLPRHVATQLAAQTVLGAAKMVLETGKHPGSLKDEVTSPGGTTIAGLHALEEGGLRGTVMNAVVTATDRSRELGKSE